MPMLIHPETGGHDVGYHNVFIGRIDHPSHVKLVAGALTPDTVDERGYLKPGVPLTIGGRLPNGTAGDYVYGLTIEEMKIAEGNTGPDLAAAAALGLFAVVNVDGLANRDLIISNLGRDLNADELAAFDHAKTKIQLTKTV